jgi:hypothetical protein
MCVGGGGGGAKSDNWNFHYQFGITASLHPAAHQGKFVGYAKGKMFLQRPHSH